MPAVAEQLPRLSFDFATLQEQEILPADYESLDSEGKRKARVAAASHWKDPVKAVLSWAFFRAYYLESLSEGQWYPKDLPHYASPTAHYSLVYDIHAQPRNAKGYPRAFAKSTIIHEIILKWACTRPHTKILLLKSMDDFIREAIEGIKHQLEDNPRIKEDFGVLKPTRGKGIWTGKRLWLNNGFQLAGRSIMSKLPGFRPAYIFCDDAEFDPRMRVSPQDLAENFQALYFGHLRPMLEAGTGISILGTTYNAKLFLYWLCTCETKDDPRVGFFNRSLHSAADQWPPPSDRSVEGLLWPEKWSWEKLEEIELEIGIADFMANYMLKPGVGSVRLMQVDPVNNTYSVSPFGPVERCRFRQSEAVVTAARTARGLFGTVVERRWANVVEDMYRIIVCDPNRKAGPRGDFAAVMAVGVERNAEFDENWSVLDMRMGRVEEDEFLNWIIELGSAWEANAVGIECIGLQAKLEMRTKLVLSETAAETQWYPRVVPVKYEGTKLSAKPARIGRILWRMRSGRVKLPKHLLHEPPFRHLVHQIENWTPKEASLQNDDAIDCLAMIQYVVRSHICQSDPKLVSADDQVLAMLRQGRRTEPETGMPLVALLDFSRYGDQIAGAMRDAAWRRASQKKSNAPIRISDQRRRARGRMLRGF